MLSQGHRSWRGVVALTDTAWTLARVVAVWILVLGAGCFHSASAEIVAAILPSSRSVQVGTPATAFATIVNAGQSTATGCRLAPPNLPATFTFQTTKPATNELTGTPNAPVDIAAGTAQTFVFALIPTMAIAPTDVALGFVCTNTNPAPSVPGLNTLLLSAEDERIPDIVALAAVPTGDGIVTLTSSNDTGVFAVASVNVGAGAQITAAADTRGASLPVNIMLCQTNPLTGTCLASPTPTVTTQINGNATPTFGVFVAGNGLVAFDPARNRITVRFTDARGIVRGATSVAVRTLPTVTLSANPTSVQVNQTTTISWVISNATSCTASGDWSGPKSSTGGSETINVGSRAGSPTYTLSCAGAGGTKTTSIMVSVLSGPPNCQLVSNGDRFIQIVNDLNVGLEVFLPQFAFEDDIRPGPGACDTIGLTIGASSFTVQVEITQCTNSAEKSECASTFGPTRRLNVLIRRGETQTITVGNGFF
jgi:hypothetical protein